MTRPIVTSHIDGGALRFGGEVVEIYPSIEAASEGRKAAHEALAMLAATLAQTHQRNQKEG